MMNIRSALIIDDSEMQRGIIRSMLLQMKVLSCDIQVAPNAEIAVERCRQTQFQLVLCDFNLGDRTNGFQLYDQLKSLNLLRQDCAFVVVTGDSTPELVRSFFELQPDAYLVKPLTYKVLSSRLPPLIERKKRLAPLRYSQSLNDHEKVLSLVGSVPLGDYATQLELALIAAESQLALSQVDEAVMQLLPHRESALKGKVQLLLYRCYTRQGAKESADFALQEARKCPHVAGEVAMLEVELALQAGEHKAALECLSRAHTAAPLDVERTLLLSQLYRLNDDYAGAVEFGTLALKDATHSFRFGDRYYHSLVQVMLDQLQFTPTEEEEGELDPKWLAQLEEVRKARRKDFNSEYQKRTDTLHEVRLQLLKYNYEDAQVALAKYEALVELDPQAQQTCSLFERYDRLLAYAMIGQRQRASLCYNEMKKQVEDQALTLLHLDQMCYADKVQLKLEALAEKAEEMTKAGQEALVERRFSAASNQLVQAFRLQRAYKAAALLMLHAFTKARPTEIEPEDLKKLMTQAQNLLKTDERYYAKAKPLFPILAKHYEFEEIVA